MKPAFQNRYIYTVFMFFWLWTCLHLTSVKLCMHTKVIMNPCSKRTLFWKASQSIWGYIASQSVMYIFQTVLLGRFEKLVTESCKVAPGSLPMSLFVKEYFTFGISFTENCTFWLMSCCSYRKVHLICCLQDLSVTLFWFLIFFYFLL